jgi:ribosome maturation factor RimP
LPCTFRENGSADIGMALDLDKIRTLAERVAASHGLAVVEVEYIGNPKQRALRVYIEKDAASRAKLEVTAEPGELKLPEHVSVDQLAGIRVGDCQVFSEDFGTVLDVEDLIPGADYTLEVSSPGLDRKLRGLEDYERFTGSLVKLRTVEPIEGNSHWQGRILKVSGEELELDLSTVSKRKSKAVAAAVGKNVIVALSNISKANLVPEV